MKHAILLFISIFLFSACCPKVFSQKCIKNKTLVGHYKVNDTRFYYFIDSGYSKPPNFDSVKIYYDKPYYFFNLFEKDNLVETKKLKLKPKMSGVYEHPKNHHFTTFLLVTYFGGYNRYFGINTNDNLIIKSDLSGRNHAFVYFLILPFPIHGCGTNPRFSNIELELERIN